MKVLLLGALSTGKLALDTLHAHGSFEVMLMSHDKKDASDFTSCFDVAKNYEYETVCLDYDIAPPKNVTLAPGGINGTYAYTLAQEFAPDVGLCMGWSEFIRSPMLSLPSAGFIGHHESLLPKRRGRAPIAWAVIHGLRESGVSFFKLTEGVDDGDIVAQRAFSIRPDDYARDVLDRANGITRALLMEEVLPMLASGKVEGTPQNHDEATYTHRRTPDMGMLDFTKSAQELCYLIRGISHPYPGAFAYNGLKRVTIWRVEGYWCQDSTKTKLPAPGTVILTGGRPSVVCGDGAVLMLTDYQGEIKHGDRLGCWA